METMSKMTTTINYNDWETAYHAWEAIRQLLNAKGYPEVLEAMQGITPELRGRVSALATKLRRHVPELRDEPDEEDDDEHPADLPKRTLRWDRMDTKFSNFENLACYKFVVLDEASKLRRDAWRHVIPYGVEPRPDILILIERYRWAYTHMERGSGLPYKQYATPTIRRLIEFGPSHAEMDEAAYYYRDLEHPETDAEDSE